MAMNRYVQLKEFKPDLYAPPTDLIGKAMMLSQDRYDKNFKIANEIKTNFIQSLPQDRKRANELEQQYSGQVDAIVNKYRGDYSQASNELNQLLYNIKRDFGPGGEAGAIMNNFNAYKEWVQNSQDMIEKGKALAEDFNDAQMYEMSKYQGVGQRDPVTGNYNRFNPETLAEYVDPEEIVQKVSAATKPRKMRRAWTEFKDGLQIDRVEELSGVTADRLHPAFKQALTANPKLMAYMQQVFRRKGVPEDQIYDMVDQYMSSYSADRAMNLATPNIIDESKSRIDPLRLAKYKSDLSKQNMSDIMGSFFQYEPTVDVLSRNESSITPENYQTGVNMPVSRAIGRDIATGVIEGNNALLNVMGLGKYKTQVPEEYNYGDTQRNFSELIEDPLYLARTNVDPDLAKAAKKVQISKIAGDPEAAQRTYEQKYGKDPKWTKEFDRNWVKYYKENEKNFSRSRPMSMPIQSPEANKQVANRLAGALKDPNRVAIYEVGKPHSTTAADIGLTVEDLISEDGVFPQISYVLPQEGYIAAGYQVPTKKGTFVFIDQDTRRQAASKELEAGINSIFNLKTGSGKPIQIGEDDKGNAVYGKLSKEYLPNQAGFLDQYIFADLYKSDAKGKMQPTGERHPISLEKLYENYIPQFEGAFGSGASKSEMTLFPLLYQMQNYAE